MTDKNKKTIITPSNKIIDFKFLEVIQYIDLISMFIKRDFTVFYKQTLLGPLWYLIQPLVNTLVFTIIFGKLAEISTDGLPQFIFYMSGTILWSYFSVCVSSIGNTFIANKEIFSKVYFPRISVPISTVVFSFLQFFLQFFIFLGFYFYFFFKGSDINPNLSLIYFPLLLIFMVTIAIGVGLIISSITSKYRDLSLALPFLLQLGMFASPVVYPFSLIPDNYKILSAINPMTSVIELFRGMFFGVTEINLFYISVSLFVTLVLFILGLILFFKVEKNFMDTV